MDAAKYKANIEERLSKAKDHSSFLDAGEEEEEEEEKDSSCEETDRVKSTASMGLDDYNDGETLF